MTVLLAGVAATAGVTVHVSGGGSLWNVTYRPPTLVNPAKITITDSTQTTSWPAFGGHPAGPIYNISIPSGSDAIVTQDTSKPLTHPVRIIGGNNVRIIGLDISLVAQSIQGSLHKVPNGIACQLIGNRTMFVEGCRIEMNGCHADQFVTRNQSNLSSGGVPARNSIFQNTACQGARGTWATHPDGDYLHSDFHQNQGLGAEPQNQLIFENISQRTTATGIVVHDGINEIICKNFDFDQDDRYTQNVHVLNPLWTDSGKTSWQNVWTDFPVSAGMPAYIRYSDQGLYYSYQVDGVVRFSPEIHQGHPPGGSFAPWPKVGLDYVSPHPL